MEFSESFGGLERTFVDVFRNSFAASEGVEEGRVIADLVAALLEARINDDIRPFAAVKDGEFIGAVVFSFISSDVIAAVYGQDFYASGRMLNWLLLGIVPFSLANLLQGYLSGANLVKQIFYSSAIGFSITLVGDWLLVPPYGAIGAAVTTVAAYCTMTVYLVWVFRQSANIPYRDFLLPKREDIQMLKRLVNRK